MQLIPRVRHEQVADPVAGVVGDGDAHAGVRVVDVRGTGDVAEPEPESGRIVRDGFVQVEPVRVLVVRDEEIEPPVAVDVGEDRSEPVLHRLRLDPDLLRHLSEARPPSAPLLR